MKITKANIKDAKTIGYLHSTAWKQTYADIFPEKYLNEDTPFVRTQEFLEAVNNEKSCYYLLYEKQKEIGIIKIINITKNSLEIASMYLLKEFRNKAFGKSSLLYLQQEYKELEISLWVLEKNIKARKFYKENGFQNTGNKRIICRGNSFTQLQYKLVFSDKNCY